MCFRCSDETVRNVKFRPCCTPRSQPFPHDGEALLKASLHDARPAAQHVRVRDSDGRPVAREQRKDDAHRLFYFLRLAADLVQFGYKPQRLGKRGAMVKITRKPKAFLHLPDGVVRITHYCGDEGVDHVTADARIMAPVLQGLLAMRVASVQSKSARDMMARHGKGASCHKVWPCSVVRLQHERGIPARVCHAEQFIHQSAGRRQIASRERD